MTKEEYIALIKIFATTAYYPNGSAGISYYECFAFQLRTGINPNSGWEFSHRLLNDYYNDFNQFKEAIKSKNIDLKKIESLQSSLIKEMYDI